MDSQPLQIIDYIRHYLSQGYTEADIRSYLKNQGWPQESVDGAFAIYYETPTLPVPVPYFQPDAVTPQPASTQPKRKLPPVKLLVAAALVVVLVIAVLATQFMSAPKAPAGNAQNTARVHDIKAIETAVASYISTYKGALPQSTATDPAPHTLDICDIDCVSGKRPVKLSNYKNTPTAVQFRSFAKNLKVPDAETVYIVNNAICNSDKSGLGSAVVKAKKPAVAFLYALKAGSTNKQQCLNL